MRKQVVLEQLIKIPMVRVLPLLLILLGWQNPIWAVSHYEVLGLTLSEFTGLDAAQSERKIKMAYRRLAVRLHPEGAEYSDGPGVKDKFNAVNVAFDVLMDTHVHRQAEGLRARVERHVAQALSESRYRSTGVFGDIFRALGNDEYRMFLTLEDEFRYVTQQVQFKRPLSDAVYQALVGNGFGYPDFYERFPATERSFHHFLQIHLGELLYPEDASEVSKDQVMRLIRCLQVSPHPALEDILTTWLNETAADNACPQLVLPQKKSKRRLG